MRCCDCEFRNRCDETEKVLTSFAKCYKRDRLLKKQKMQTNADKIRSMTDEELARVMDMVCPPDTACNDGQQCIKCWIEWLKQPAEEERS